MAGEDIGEQEPVAAVGGVNGHEFFGDGDEFAVEDECAWDIRPWSWGAEEDFGKLDTWRVDPAGFAGGRVGAEHFANGGKRQFTAMNGLAPFPELHLAATEGDGVSGKPATEANVCRLLEEGLLNIGDRFGKQLTGLVVFAEDLQMLTPATDEIGTVDDKDRLLFCGPERFERGEFPVGRGEVRFRLRDAFDPLQHAGQLHGGFHFGKAVFGTLFQFPVPFQGLVIAGDGAFEIAEIGHAGVALEIADAVVGAGKIADEGGVVIDFAAHLFEVFQGGGDEDLAGLGDALGIGEGVFNIEQKFVSELAGGVEAIECGGALGGGLGGVLLSERFLAIGFGEGPFGAVAFLFGLGAGVGGDLGLLERPDGTGGKAGDEEQEGREREPVAASELGGGVGKRMTAGFHRETGEVASEIGGQLVRRAVTPFGFTGERLFDDAIEIGGDFLFGDAAGQRDVAFDDVLDEIGEGAVAGSTNGAAGEEFEEHSAERIDVGGGGDGLAGDLFGTGVIGREERMHGRRHAVIDADQLGDAEVEEFGSPVGIDEDIGRFEIAVNDEVAMGVGDGVANGGEDGAAIVEG